MNFDDLMIAMNESAGELKADFLGQDISDTRVRLVKVVLGFLRDASREFLAESFSEGMIATADNQTKGMWLRRALVFLLTEYWGASYMPSAVTLPSETVLDLLARTGTDFVEVRQLIEKVRDIEISLLFGMSEIAYAIDRC